MLTIWYGYRDISYYLLLVWDIADIEISIQSNLGSNYIQIRYRIDPFINLLLLPAREQLLNVHGQRDVERRQ